MAFESIFAQAFLYLSAALAAVLVGKRLGVGSVLGYLIAGAAIGPWGLKLIGRESEQITHFAEFGVTVMLFLIGLELQPAMLWRMRRQIFILGLFQVLLSAGALCGLGILLGLPWQPSLAIGLILAMSSTAIVLQSLAEKGLLQTEGGQSAFAVLLFQDLAVIPILAVLPLLATLPQAADASHGSASWIDHWPQWTKPFVILSAVAAMIGFSRIIVRPLFRAIAKTHQREAFTAAALILVIGVALLMTKIGLSAALGAFVAGVVLANSEYRHELESDLEPFKGLLLGLFFLGVGTGIDFGHIAANLGAVLGIAGGLLLVKGTLLFGLSRLRGAKRGPSILFSAALAGGGEFAFVLTTLAVAEGVVSTGLARTLTAVVALSMAATPLLLLLARRFSTKPAAAPSDRESDVHDQGSPVIICGFGRFGHSVGRLLLSQGYGCTILDNDPDQVDTLRSIGLPVFYGDADRPDLLLTAGAPHARILVVALKDPATTLRIVETTKKHFPHLKLYLRAYSRVEAYEYFDAGEQRVYRDTLDSSLTLATDVLHALGKPRLEARRITRRYRKTDEAQLRKMGSHRHDRKTFLDAARESQRILDEIMRAEPVDHPSKHTAPATADS